MFCHFIYLKTNYMIYTDNRDFLLAETMKFCNSERDEINLQFARMEKDVCVSLVTPLVDVYY